MRAGTDNWMDTLALFNDRNIGHDINLIVFDHGLHVRSVLKGARLCGAAFEPAEDSIDILLEEGVDEHVLRTFEHVESIDMLIPGFGGADVLEVAYEDGVALLTTTPGITTRRNK